MPEFIAPYQPAVISLIALTLIVLVQSFLGAFLGFVKGGKVPGAPLEGGHDDVGFRALRCYQNGVENLPAFAAALIAAILVGASAATVNLLAILHLALRVVYSGVYYAGIGKPAGGPRSLLYVVGWGVNIALAIVALLAALN